MSGEFDLIERIFGSLTGCGADVVQGIGDDCALVRVPPDQALALTTDTLIEGIHFPRETAPEDIGWKALACSLSDLAAAGAEPRWAMLALAVPEADEAWLRAFAHGFAELSARSDISLIGGDLVRAPTVTVTVQAGGHVPPRGSLRRTGASPGDGIYVSGWPGEAAAGLAALAEGSSGKATQRLIDRLNRPSPRTELGIALRGLASACVDISDGLAADLCHVLRASDCGAALDADALPVSANLAAVGDRARIRQLILHGGDDYELCFCAPDRNAHKIRELSEYLQPISRIGVVEDETGLRLVEADGRIEILNCAGYDHFPGGGQ